MDDKTFYDRRLREELARAVNERCPKLKNLHTYWAGLYAERLLNLGEGLDPRAIAMEHANIYVHGAIARDGNGAVAMPKRPYAESDLIVAVARENPRLTVRQVSQVIDTVFDAIADALAHGRRADFRGFGVFSTRERPEREVRNPRDGTFQTATAHRVLHFRAGRAINQTINSPQPSPFLEADHIAREPA